MTMREEVIRILRKQGKTEEEIKAHMAKVDEFVAWLATVAPTTRDVATDTDVPTAGLLDLDNGGESLT